MPGAAFSIVCSSRVCSTVRHRIFLMGSPDYNSTSLTHFLVNRFGDSFKILTINQCSSQDFFIERGEKTGGGEGRVYCYGPLF